MGVIEDEVRVDAEDALGELEGLDVRRMFSGWGFYQRGLLFAAAWDGAFRWRVRRAGHWCYDGVDPALLDDPPALVVAARQVIADLEAEPLSLSPSRRRSG
jgi:hypothetical protein